MASHDLKMHKFYRKLARFGKIKHSDVHRYLGNHFGYPKCCIDNFVKLNKKGILVYLYMLKNHNHPETKKPLYVMCKSCIKRYYHV